MHRIGFSTGALALGDVCRGVGLVRDTGLRAVELSALRADELPGLMQYIKTADLSDFDYVSVHAPSAFPSEMEAEIIKQLTPALDKEHHIVVHPDTIHDARRWRQFGRFLCVENMDKRKPSGRTAEELSEVFRDLPDASFCLDVGHARQVDPTMGIAAELIRDFGDRLAQVHMSDVNSSSRHERLNLMASRAFGEISELLSVEAPVILESPLHSEPESRIRSEIAGEIARARRALMGLGRADEDKSPIQRRPSGKSVPDGSAACL